MLIRKKTGEAEGWATAVCLKSATVFDEVGNPNNVDKGTEYYVQGDVDPAIFEVKGSSKPKPKPEPEPKEDKEEF
jgi:hypothetical protein